MFKKLFVTFLLCFITSSVSAGGSVEASAQALNSSFEALGYSIEAGFKLASGAAAVPLISIGQIGNVSGEMGEELWDIANTPPTDRPLPISDEVITIGPNPAEQLESQHKE